MSIPQVFHKYAQTLDMVTTATARAEKQVLLVVTAVTYLEK
jgi:hypothetical protein